MKPDVTFLKKLRTNTDTLIIPVYTDERRNARPGQALDALDQDLQSAVRTYLDRNPKFTGRFGKTAEISPVSGSDFTRILLLGMGPQDQLDHNMVETAGAHMASALENAGAQQAGLVLDGQDKTAGLSAGAFAAHLSYGAVLAAYRFSQYKSKTAEDGEGYAGSADRDIAQTPELQRLDVITDSHSAAEQAYQPLGNVAESVCLARDLVNEPPNILYPESFAERIFERLKPLGVHVDILDEKRLQKLGMGAVMAVGKGSERPPRLVIMHWRGGSRQSRDEKPLAFVGKGITFDTGGISLKPGSGMEEMKLDMGGAAAVTGLMQALALNGVDRDVVGVVALAENMPSHMAYRPSDIITTYSGKTVEVMNTDAEGRLVLADALSYVQEKYDPESVIDLATLTGAMMVALGSEYAGTFVSDDALWDKLEVASKSSGDKLWRMPLDDVFRRDVESDVADIQNLGKMGRFAGACTAAGFLSHFIDQDRPWAHIDIAGTAFIRKATPLCRKGGTGFGVRALYDYVSQA